MCGFKTPTGICLWVWGIASQATGAVIRVGLLNRTTEFARPQSVRIA